MVAEGQTAVAVPAARPPTTSGSPCLAAAAPREQLMALLAGEAGLRRAEVSRVHRDDLLSWPQPPFADSPR